MPPLGFVRQIKSHLMIQNLAFPPWLVHARFNFASFCSSWSYMYVLWHHYAVNHPNGVSLCCPLRMINIDGKNIRQLILINTTSTVPLCSLESRTLALRKHDIYQMELLKSRTISANALLDIVDLEDNIWAGGISIWCIRQQCRLYSDNFLARQVYSCWNKINKSADM